MPQTALWSTTLAGAMDGGNVKRPVFDAFFKRPVTVGDSLVFIYLKHSPLQEQRGDRLLVGAAQVTGVAAAPAVGQRRPVGVRVVDVGDDRLAQLASLINRRGFSSLTSGLSS